MNKQHNFNNINNKLQHFKWLSLFNSYSQSDDRLPYIILLVLYYLCIVGHCDSLAQMIKTKAPVLESLDKLGLIKNDLHNPYVLKDAKNCVKRYTLTNLGVKYIQYAFPQMHFHKPKERVYDLSRYICYIMGTVVTLLLVGLIALLFLPTTHQNKIIALKMITLVIVSVIVLMFVTYYHSTKYPKIDRVSSDSSLMFFLDLCEDSREHYYIYMPYITRIFYHRFLEHGQHIHQSDLAKFLINNNKQETIQINNNDYYVNLIKSNVFL